MDHKEPTVNSSAEELTESQMEEVSGGLIPKTDGGLDKPDLTKVPSTGPVIPTPYPNTGTVPDSGTSGESGTSTG